MKHKLFHIVATTANKVIGKNNQLPWPKNSADLKFFKETTMGSTLIMGRKTFESLGRRLLPGRENFVLSRSALSVPDGVKVFHSLDEAVEKATNEKVFIIGGGELYRETIDRIDGIYRTEIEGEYEGDTYYLDPIPATFRENESKSKELREKYAIPVTFFERQSN